MWNLTDCDSASNVPRSFCKMRFVIDQILQLVRIIREVEYFRPFVVSRVGDQLCVSVRTASTVGDVNCGSLKYS